MSSVAARFARGGLAGWLRPRAQPRRPWLGRLGACLRIPRRRRAAFAGYSRRSLPAEAAEAAAKAEVASAVAWALVLAPATCAASPTGMIGPEPPYPYPLPTACLPQPAATPHPRGLCPPRAPKEITLLDVTAENADVRIGLFVEGDKACDGCAKWASKELPNLTWAQIVKHLDAGDMDDLFENHPVLGTATPHLHERSLQLFENNHVGHEMYTKCSALTEGDVTRLYEKSPKTL
eukprot:4971912-Pyramimonas_sp.AAC.1